MAIEAGVRGEDWVSCTNVALNMTLSALFVALNLFLIVVVVKIKKCREARADLRLWIPIANLLLNLFLLILNTFDTDDLNKALYATLRTLCRLFRVIAIYLLFLHFFWKSRILLLPPDQAKVQKAFILCSIFVLLDLIAILLVYGFFIDASSTTFENFQCRTLTTSMLDAFSLLIFCLGALIACIIRAAMERAKKITQVIKSRFSLDIEQVQARTLKKTTFFLYFLIVVNVYGLVNSMLAFFFFSDACVP